MIVGKDSYDKIKIPDHLDTVRTDAMIKAKRRMRRERSQRYGMIAAAFMCVFLLCNNDTVYAGTSEIPVIGTLVRFLHIGEGGEITDGAKGQFADTGDALDISFTASDITTAPHYKVEYHTMPRRITISLNGVREFDRENINKMAAETMGIEDLYFLTVLDDSQVRFTVELADGMGYQVEEYRNPASLKIRFGAEYDKAETEPEKMWTVRIPSMENGEPLAMVQELFSGSDIRVDGDKLNSDSMQIVKTQSGLFTMTIGNYKTKEEAEKAAKALNQATLSDKIWYAEQNKITENPK